MRDKYESYTAAPLLVQALEGYPRRVSSDSASQQKEGDDAGGMMYGGRRLGSMSLLDILNDFRESNGMPLLPT